MQTTLDEATATRLVGIALGHVAREFPNKLDHVLAEAGDARTPRDLHPLFFGSFDWHSCVHSYWMLAHLLRRYPGMPLANDVAAVFDANFERSAVEAECLYLRAPSARGFERPYGWAWLLKLAEELSFHPGRSWFSAITPLSDLVARRFVDHLPKALYPVRTGSHANSAFAIRLAFDYAATTEDDELLSLLRETAWRWYRRDEDCPAWGEPGGEDFLSPTLVEAECMRRVLPTADFASWFERFLPDLARRSPQALFEPVLVSDRTDGRIAHLDGLNLSRAWCLTPLARTLVRADDRQTLEDAARLHLAAALPHLASHYMGEHWLGTFAVLALIA